MSSLLPWYIQHWLFLQVDQKKNKLFCSLGIIIINQNCFLLNKKAMAYDEKLANRVRSRFEKLKNVEEKEMMGGLTFMYHDKMCVGIIKDELMCRIDPELHESVVEMQGCRTMDFTKRPMKGYIMVDETGMEKKKEFDYWIDLAIDYNKKAKSSRKKKKQ